jgi:hypothetical protein
MGPYHRTLLFTLQMMPLPWSYALKWFQYFILGSLCYLFRNRLPLWIPGAVLALALSIFLIRHSVRGGHPIFQVALCYVILTIGYHPAIYVRVMRLFGDYSYGLYIYGLPIQQSLVRHFHKPLPFFLVCYPLILLAALFSWHFVEEPALSLKHRFRKDTRNSEPPQPPTLLG